MLIPSAYIATQARDLSLASLPVNYPSTGQRQAQAITDTYNKNTQHSSAQIIDAEYVEFYTPSSEVLNKELHYLYSTLEAEALEGLASQKSNNPLTQAVEKYQESSKSAAKAPGLILNVYG